MITKWVYIEVLKLFFSLKDNCWEKKKKVREGQRKMESGQSLVCKELFTNFI